MPADDFPMRHKNVLFTFLLAAVTLTVYPVYGKPPSPGPAEPALINSNADTIDGVVFTTSTDKKIYHSGDSLHVRYRIKNRSMGTVTYDFNTSCQCILEVSGSNGNSVYSKSSTGLLSDRPEGCEPVSSLLKLAPSTEHIMVFTAVPLRYKNTDTLTVKVQMSGYPLSIVPVKVLYIASQAPSGPVALEWSTENKPDIEFNSETKMLLLRVNRSQKLTISAFILTGQKMNKLSCERFLAPGTHQISFNNPKLADGVVIFKVEGNGFSQTKTINLSR